MYTSSNGRLWEQDAKYFYYDHGPLARVEIGDKKVQAIDYAYTIQGWLKGVNSEDLNTQTDMGQDGVAFTPDKLTGIDAFAYSLHYYNNDFEARVGNTFLPYSESGTVTVHNYDLFNGNIKEMYTTLRDADEINIGSSHNMYRYDQLNRIKAMNQELVTTTTGVTVTAGKYQSNYWYDPNGNLDSLERWMDISGTKTMIDDFKYHYQTISGNSSNQLDHVDDGVGAGTATIDVDDQAADNYQYDQIGQLIGDDAEQIESIEWTVTGKVKRINRDNGSGFSDLEFRYDAMGNRILKAEYDNAGNLLQKTFYFADAQGNVMSIYTLSEASLETNLYLGERNIYGSSRLGTEVINKVIASSDVGNITMTSDTNRFVGDKLYEISNHLGNVLEVITDRKLPVKTTEDHVCYDSGSSEYTATAAFNAGLGTDMTLEAWVKTTNTTGTYTVASYYLGGATNKGGILFIVNGKCQFDGRNGSSTYYSSGAGSTNVADGNWHHVVGTCNNGVWSIYVDGQLENSYTGASGSFSGLSQKVYIGRNEYGSYLKGCAKEVSLWDYDKTATEIYDDYINYQGYTGSETGNKGYWKSDEGTGSSLNDLTSGNHDMTLYNTPTWTTDDYVIFNYCDVQQYQDYMPFGMMQTGRSGGADGYRYGFQGQEADDEVKGEGNSYNTFYRQLDPRIGRWLSIDPKASAWETPYASMANNPILMIDPLGDIATPEGTKKNKTEYVKQINNEADHINFSIDKKTNQLTFAYGTVTENGVTREYGYEELTDFEKNMVKTINSQFNVSINVNSNDKDAFISSDFKSLDVQEVALLQGSGDQGKYKSSLLLAHSAALRQDVVQQTANSLEPGDEKSGLLDEAKTLDPKVILAQSISKEFEIQLPSPGAVVFSDRYQDRANVFYVVAGTHGTQGGTPTTGVGVIVAVKDGNPGIVVAIPSVDGVIDYIEIFPIP